MKLLFICNQNKNRSKTAEELFKEDFETRSAGLFNEHPVTKEQLAWADLILVMEDSQREELSTRFPKIYLKKQIICLEIPDSFHYNQKELVQLLTLRMRSIVQPLIKQA